MSTFLNDLRFAVRTLRRAPGFALVSVLTLALGIGATAVVFSWMLVIVEGANPTPNMDRFAAVWSHNRTQGEPKNVVSPEDFAEWRTRQQSFDRFSAFWPRSEPIRRGTSAPVAPASMLWSLR